MVSEQMRSGSFVFRDLWGQGHLFSEVFEVRVICFQRSLGSGRFFKEVLVVRIVVFPVTLVEDCFVF